MGRGGSAQLIVAPQAAYEVTAEGIPTGSLGPVPPEPWDHCFVGCARPPRILWPGALVLELASTFDHWVFFTAPEHALCVEPQSGPPNQVNQAPHVAHPGRPLIGSMRYRWSDAP